MKQSDYLKQISKHPNTNNVEKKDKELWDSLKRGYEAYNKSRNRGVDND